MAGISNLKTILTNLQAEINEGVYVFCSVKYPLAASLEQAVMLFSEKEGTTLILKKEDAINLNYEYSFEAAWITLKVHSSLEAVGLTAACSKALSDNGISCNMVAAYYHDHIFVQKEKAELALSVLKNLSAKVL